MSQRLRFQLSDKSVAEESENLKHLLKNYINRSEELEKKESHVMKQVELMQSALHSLQSYNKQMETKILAPPARRSINEIEEETQKIREETARIQMEVKQKIALNKILQEQVNRRKGVQAPIKELATEPYSQDFDEGRKSQKVENFGSGSRTPLSTESDLDQDPGLAFFNEKLKKLQEMERKMKQQSEEEEKQSRKKRRELEKKVEMLEWESEMEKQLLETLRRKGKPAER